MDSSDTSQTLVSHSPVDADWSKVGDTEPAQMKLEETHDAKDSIQQVAEHYSAVDETVANIGEVESAEKMDVVVNGSAATTNERELDTDNMDDSHGDNTNEKKDSESTDMVAEGTINTTDPANTSNTAGNLGSNNTIGGQGETTSDEKISLAICSQTDDKSDEAEKNDVEECKTKGDGESQEHTEVCAATSVVGEVEKISSVDEKCSTAASEISPSGKLNGVKTADKMDSDHTISETDSSETEQVCQNKVSHMSESSVTEARHEQPETRACTGSQANKTDNVLQTSEMVTNVEKSAVKNDGDAAAKTNEDQTNSECPQMSKVDQTSASESSSSQSPDKPVKYKCPKCSRVMKDKRLIDNHSCDNEGEEEKVKITIVLDKDQKVFVCRECDYSNSGHGFEEHLMCHLMIRPYQCLYCKECFINRKEISRHVLKSHNGAKMSCALRALRKAKALIKEVTSSGIISFMAKVAGKVPLEKDPEKKKKADDSTDQDSSDKPAETGQSSKETKTAKLSEPVTPSETANKHPNPPGFSRLREVLTAGSAPVIPTCAKDGPPEDTPQTNDTEDPGHQNNDSGIKIVASYSLQNTEAENCHSQSDNGDNADNSAAVEPNFIIPEAVEKEKEPEVLSFLGPDQPIFKTADENSSPLLPPPPLQPAPTHSSSNSSSLPPAPRLASGALQSGKNPNFFVCGFNCLFSSLSTSEFKEHTINFHSNETYFPCYYCGHRSPNENDLVRHISNHTHTHNKISPLYVCGNDGCRFGTNMVTDYISHIRASHPEISEPLCYSCGEIFSDASMLQAHVEENVIHIVNCPHCPSKATDRRTILNHISSNHPGKPKMVSVAKQLICHDRKLNNYEEMKQLREMLPPTLTPAPTLANGGSVIDQILSRQEPAGGHGKSGNSLSDILSSRASVSPRNSPSPSARMLSPSAKRKLATPDSGKSPNSESSDFSGARVKEEFEEDRESVRSSGEGDEQCTTYAVDENGVRRRIYVPMSERQAENYKCKHCTFIARDLKRLHCHERSHGMPPTRKERFKCMFCPQGFDSEMKFRLHITCHPGLIKFLLYRCKKCEFDTNQKHTIIKHVTCNRDRKHRGSGPVEDQYTLVSRSLESRVLECERCDYMTRHKIHMAIHYQREHSILRDKGEFTIEGLTPIDTPLSTYDNTPRDQTSSSPRLQSPNGNSNSLDGVFDFTKPSGTAKKARDKSTSDTPLLTVSQITERNELFKKMVSQQAALQPAGQVLENQMRKFKCPICKYLLPKAADLKNHVKRHSEIGQITLVMFRCKYCSCMSTARELLYDHLNEKHPGKPIALVKKIVVIDTTEVDKSFAETSMEESLDQLEESLHKEIMSNLESESSSKEERESPSYEKLFVIPEGGETFSAALQCPKCQFSSFIKSEIVQHVTALHSEIKVISSDEDVDNLAKATSEDIQQEAAAAAAARSEIKKTSKPFNPGQEEVLIVPDDQIFKESALCSRCDFSTTLRREMVIHLQRNHPDISVMGRNSYPVQVAAMGRRLGPTEESCVVGSGSLDAKIRCLYENYGTQMKCLICGTERPKKFFIHVHILRHLNIYLWKCAFCAHRGLQKYKMVDHIKKIHPGRPMSVRYLRVNVENKVAQFLAQFSVIKNRKASLDEGLNVPYIDELMDNTSDDGSRTHQKCPVPGGSSSGQSSCTLGSDDLDERISCLYDFSDGVFYKCIACPNQFQRKFAIHRHIIITHLKVALLSCSYCGMEGVEKHQMIDHILACHKPQPINIQTLDVDIGKKISEFLAKVAAGELTGGSGDASKSEVNEIMHSLSSSSTKLTDFADDYYERMFQPYANKKLKLDKAKSPLFRFGNKTATKPVAKKINAVDPDVIMLGRPALDRELSCLYQERPMGQLRCLVCRWEFPRKYPLHRHIMLKHLKMNLVGCPYCPFEGIEKYNVSTHIKEEHKDKPINIKYTQPDVKTRVRQFIDDTAMIGSRGQELIRKPTSRDHSPSVFPRAERDVQSDENNDNDGKEPSENDNIEEDDDKKSSASSREHQGGLVVAMFGKKKTKSPSTTSDDIVVKTEVVDEEYEEGSALHTNDDGEDEEENQYDEDVDDYNEDDDPGADKSNYDPSDDSSSSFSTLKRPLMESYAPGSYRSPAGGKPKALDVITKIKVLKSKEGPITKFYCEMCKFTSLHRSNIVRHIYKIHEKYQTHTCPVCNYQTLSLMLMQKHTEKDHPGVEYKEDSFTLNPPRSKPRSRPIMGPLSFQRKRQDLLRKKLAAKSLASPSTSHQGPKQYACAYCHYETNTQEDILQHTRDNHSQSDDQRERSTSSSGHITSKPEDRFSACWDRSKKAVKRKLQDDSVGMIKRKRRFVFEKGDELVQCGHCDTRETSMARMQDHLTWDHPGLPFKAKHIPAWRFVCKSCAVKTMATSKMKYHLNRHVNYRPYTCSNCGAFFPSPDQCRRHSRAQGHEEQYMYVRNPKKESRVEELLEKTRQLALTIQVEAAKDKEFDIANMDSFIGKFQDSRTNLKRNPPTPHLKSPTKKVKESVDHVGAVEEGSHTKKQYGKSPQTVGVEQDITIKCYRCDFTAANVNDVRSHHVENHAGERFLWTEMDRGFTCDETGEALPDCETVPSASSDVGYTTKMTLGSGSNTMRFKCKTCNFSSCVIQAMKSHLKSHQPKGFICPYCSRSFSGKEKLMRHQYCLHKGQHLWVIHLRMSGVTGSTSVKKTNKTIVTSETVAGSTPEQTSPVDETVENKEKDVHNSLKTTVKRNTPHTSTTYHCSECSYTTISLYHYRLHLAQQHEEFKYKVLDSSIDSPLKCGYCAYLAETEADFSAHIETHFSARSFQCGYCDYSAYDRVSVQRHLGSNHAPLSPKVIDLGATSRMGQEYVKGQERKDLPLLLNLMPDVTIERVPESVLSQYGCVAGEGGASEEEEEGENSDSFMEEAELHHSNDKEKQDFNGEDNNDDDDEDRLMVVEGVSEMDAIDDEDDADGEEVNDETVGKAGPSRTDSVDSDLTPAPTNDSEELARQLGLVEDQTSCVLGSDTDMMIMQFGGMAGEHITNVAGENSGHSDVKNSGTVIQQINFQVDNSSPAVSRSKDSTLFSAQERDENDDNNLDDDDDDDDDDDEVNFDNDITLASPLPMISLGDGVAMSPVTMDSQAENADGVLKTGAHDNSEILLDI